MSSWNITDGKFKNLTFHVATAKRAKQGIQSQEITKERRLQVSERAMVDGADVEDFGAKPRLFSATVVFFGDNYQDELKAFEAVLDQGTTGTLILPDLDEAVLAKFQKSSRVTQTESSTVLNVNWIEDRSKVIQSTSATTAAQAQAALENGNTAQAIPTIQEQAAAVNSKSDSSLSALNNNPFVKALQAAENSVVNSRVQINSVLNVPRNARQQILGTVGRINGEISGLKNAVNGLLNFTDLLSLGLSFASPTRINSGLGKVDFSSVDTVSTQIVSGISVVNTNTSQPKNIQSFKEAEKELKKSVKVIDDLKKDLEDQTQGNTDDFNSLCLELVNSVKDLIFVIEEKSTKQVMTTMRTSLLEVCFYNGLTVDDIDRIYKINTQLDDILDIPAFTVVNL